MAEYYIAGRADDQEFAKAEHLGELIMTHGLGKCHILPQPPDAWESFAESTCRKLGCASMQPLVWTATGKVVGSRAEFERECDAKYRLRVEPSKNDATWKAVAKENACEWGGQAPEGDGAVADGESVREALLVGHERFLASGGKPGAGAALGGGSPVATVVQLAPVAEAAAHALFDVEESALFVVPCAAGAIDDYVVGNAEHGALALGCRSLWVVGADCAELRLALSAARNQLAMRDAPVAPAQRGTVERLLPVVMRVLQVAPPGSAEEELLDLAAQEWAREVADELLRRSPVLEQLRARDTLNLVRCACDGTKRLHVV